MSKDLVKAAKAGNKILKPSDTFSGSVGKGMVVSGVGLGAAHVALALLPFVSAGILASIFLPVVLILAGIFLWE